jgi:hypothetical protein
VAPGLLVTVVAIALGGRMDPWSSVPAAVPSAASADPVEALAPAATPLPVSLLRARPDREEGTDGLMGGIPFGLPNDNPYSRPEH